MPVAPPVTDQVGLELLGRLDREHRLSTDRLTAQRTYAVRGHLLAMSGDPAGAADAFRSAADLTDNAVERAYLLSRVEGG